MSHAPPPVLNYDVLSAVIEHIETETLLSLMLCCGALYQDGVRVLLSEPTSLAISPRSHLRKQRALF
ncbi:hypothetical protein C8Q74DRAFT_1310335 [Fomes fomentarius]|nr:hypothetical protein C8Q74DRAFT_1310335 [Fomes fomentarius]